MPAARRRADIPPDHFSRPAEVALPWYFRISTIIIALGCVGPLALPLVWWRPNTKLTVKVGVTLAILFLTWWLFRLTAQTLELIRTLFGQLLPQ